MGKTNQGANYYIRLGRTIAYHRKLNKLTQAQVAERTDVTVRHIGSVEGGSPLSLDLLFVLVEQLGIPGDDVFRPVSDTQDPLRQKRAVAENLLLRCNEHDLNIVITLMASILGDTIPGELKALPNQELEPI